MFKNKKAISAVIASVMMVLFVIIATTIIWGFVSTLVNKNVEQSEDCFNIMDKISINNEYTCYNTTSNNFTFAIKIGDINITKLKVGISDGKISKNFVLTNEKQNIEWVTNSSREAGIKLPPKEGGSQYFLNIKGAGLSKPILIQIAPVIGESNCEPVDSSDIGICF